jgi:hypothetical protein
MANQFHVAFSEDVQGAAVFAGGPFYCARNNLGTALGTWSFPASYFPDLSMLHAKNIAPL